MTGKTYQEWGTNKYSAAANGSLSEESRVLAFNEAERHFSDYLDFFLNAIKYAKALSQPPVIERFEVELNPVVIPVGGGKTVMISHSVSNASYVEIQVGNEPPKSQSMASSNWVWITRTTQITLLAKSKSASVPDVTRTITVEALTEAPAVKITRFAFSQPGPYQSGQVVQLVWETEGAARVSIDSFPERQFSVNGRLELQPRNYEEFIVRAYGFDGQEAKANVRFEVETPSAAPILTAASWAPIDSRIEVNLIGKNFASLPADSPANIYSSNCSVQEKIYDGVNLADANSPHKITLRLSENFGGPNCTFKVKRADSDWSNEIQINNISLNPDAADGSRNKQSPGVLQAGGGGSTGCEAAWVIGNNLPSSNNVAIYIKDENWLDLAIVNSVSVSGTENLSFSIPDNLVEKFKTTGLRFLVLNKQLNLWDTSELTTCEPAP
jgi:hypothetical protein